MVGSRHLRGTVVSRVRNLLRSGAMTKPPVWLPVVEAFPPLKETKVNRKGDERLMHKILYPEDEFRKLFYQRFKTDQPLYLWGDHHSYCDRFVDSCMELVVKQGIEKEEAVESTFRTLFISQTTNIPVEDKDEDYEGDDDDNDDDDYLKDDYDEDDDDNDDNIDANGEDDNDDDDDNNDTNDEDDNGDH